MDMLLYERVPDLQPLRRLVLTAYGRLYRLYRDGPVDDSMVRSWYKELADHFFRFVGMLVRAGRVENLRVLKQLLQDRHRLYVKTLIVPCPGMGRVEL